MGTKTETKDLNVNSNLLDIVKEIIQAGTSTANCVLELDNGLAVTVTIVITDIGMG